MSVDKYPRNCFETKGLLKVTLYENRVQRIKNAASEMQQDTETLHK